MATNKYSDLLEGLNTASPTSGGRYDDLYLDLLSEEDRKRLQYRYQYANPAEVGPPVEKSVGLMTDILPESFGTLKAAPSAAIAGYQGSQVQAMDDAEQAGWGEAILDLGRMNPNTLINKATSVINPELFNQRREDFREGQQTNLQEALQIGEKEALELEALKQQYLEQGGSQFAADLAGTVGGSATSLAPLAGAVAIGAATRSPRAALLAQQALAPLPAIQAYAQSYTEFKRQYPDASEEDAQNYAKRSAGLEYMFEAAPLGVGKFAGTGLGAAATETARRTGREVLFEGATEANQQLLQRATTPELAPETAEDSAYNIGLAGATAGLLSGPITTLGVRGERNQNIQQEARAQQEARLAEVAAKDAEIARGMQAAQEQPAVAQAERAIAELMTSLPEGGLDLETRRGEVSTLLNTEALPQEPAGPSSPFLPRSERVNLERTRGETSTLLNVPEDAVATPRGPVSLMEGQTPETGLALDTPRGEVTPVQGPEAERARFEAQRVDAETNIAFLTEEKARLQQEPQTRQTRAQIQQIDRQIGTQAIRRAVAVKAIEQPTQQTATPEVTPVEPTNTLTRPFTPRPVEPVQEVPAPTPDPLPTQALSEAPSPAPVALSRQERVALSNLGYDGPEIRNFNPTQARTILTNRIAKSDFETGVVDSEGTIVGDVTTEQGAIAPGDVEARRALFETPRAEPLSAQEINKANEMDESPKGWGSVQAIITSPDPQANIVPKEQRKPSAFEARMEGVVNARGTLEVIRGMAAPNSPFSRVLDALEKSPFLDDVPVKIVQPEGALPRNLKKPTTRGIMQPYKGGKNAVFLRGSGFKLNGTFTPEIALHEIVHAATADLVNAVQTGRVKDAAAVAAVKQIEVLRTEMKKALETRETREGLTPSEKVALDYAGKNTDEFIAQALSSTDMQKGLKKEGLWKKLVNIVRTMFRGPRSTTPLWENIMDASLSVIDAQSRTEGEVRSARAQREAEETAKASPMDMDGELDFDAAEADIPEAQSSPPVNLNRQTPAEGFVGKLTRLLAGPQPQVIRRANEVQTGVLAAEEYVGVAISNRLKGVLDSLEKSDGVKAREALSEAAVKYLRGDRSKETYVALRSGGENFRKTLDELRARWDSNTDAIIQDIEVAFQGKAIPKAYQDLIQKMKKEKGSYLSRVYQKFADPKYGKRTWNEWLKGKDNPKKRDTPGYKRVATFVDRIGKTIESLPNKLAEFKAEAQKLGDEFEAWEMASRSDLRDYYDALIGNSDGKSVKEMFEGLEIKSKEIKEGSAANTAEIIAKVLLDPVEGDTSQGGLFRFYKNLATDDSALKKRSKINELVRNLWGEARGVEAIAAATSTRQGQVMAGLKSLNDVFTKEPGLFSDVPTIEMTKQIPNNPQKYGALAGKYVHPVVHDGVVQFSTINGDNPLIKHYNKYARMQKGFNTVWNPRADIQELIGGPVVMMANGVPPSLQTLKGIRDAVVGSKSLVGTSFRQDPNKFAEKVLRLGLIEPVVTGGIKRKDRQIQLEDQQPGMIRTAWEGAKEFAQILREAKESIEVYPGLAVFIDEMNFHLGRRPGLAEAYAKADAKPRGERTEQDKATIREMELLEEQVADRVKNTIFAFSRAPQFAKTTERYGFSSFAVYYADTFRVLGNAYRYGLAEMIQGKKDGDNELLLRGARKMVGASLASIATPTVVSIALAADIEVLGAFAVMAGAGALGVGDDEDVLRQIAILQEAQPFGNKAQSTVFTKVDEDMTVHFTDAGRWESLDPSSSTLRAATTGLIKAISEGDTSTLEDIGKSTFSQFFGGSMLVDTAVIAVRAATEEGATKVKPSVENKAPEVMQSFYSAVDTNTPISYENTRRVAAVVEKMTPAIGRNAVVAFERSRDPDSTALDVVAGLVGDFSSSWNVRDDLQGFASQQYRAEVQGARTKELGDLLFRERLVSDEALQAAYARTAERERDALLEFQKKVEAYRVVNRQLGRRPDAGLPEVLKEANLSSSLVSMALGNTPFMPQEIKDDFLQGRAETRATRVRGASEGSRQLPSLTRERKVQLQRIRQQWINENIN